MVAKIEIVVGSAGAGKTDRLLQNYHTNLLEAAKRREIPQLLWLTPTHRSRELIRRLLFESSQKLKVCFAPNIYTFDQFAEQILRHSTQSVRFLSETAKRMVVRSLVDSHVNNGQLKHFRAIAHTEGFLDLVCQFISELKRDEIWPERFLETCNRHLAGRAKDRELGQLYLSYQNFLHHPAGSEINLYDSEGRFWSARDALDRGEFGPFAQLDHVVVDGFTDFTFTQYGILQRLAERSQKMSVSLPLDSTTNRTDLFAKTAVVQTAFTNISSNIDFVPLERPASSKLPPALTVISEKLFDNPRRIVPSSKAEGLEIIAAIGPVSEVEFLARRVKKLLLQGIAPEQIVIGYRSLNEQSQLISEVFTAAGIPYFCEASLSATELPLTKALFSILQVEQEDWAYDKLMKLVDSNFFRPKWKKPASTADDSSLSPAIAISTAIRKWKMGEGRFGILRKLNWLAENEFSDHQTNEAQTQHRQLLKLAADWLNRLSEATVALRKKHSFSEWIEQIIFIARELGLNTPSVSPKPEEQLTTAQQAAIAETNTEAAHWDFLEKTLFDAVRFSEQFEVAQQPISLSEFQAQLINILQRVQYPQAIRENGVVRILEASQVRNLEIDYLFIASMSEGSFPRTQNEDCIYNESERLQFQEWDIPLGHAATRSQEEMLLFYTIITRARKQLCLSYSSVSANGEPLFPAPYLQTVQSLFDPNVLSVTHVGSLDPIPPYEEMLTSTDLRLVATEQVRLKQPALFTTLFEQKATTPAARSILTTANMSQLRFSTAGFTNYEGMLLSSHNKQELQKHFTPEYEYSTKQLESYAECPFRFMYSDLLRIRSLEAPEIKTDYLRRGIITHDILAALHRNYQNDQTEKIEEEAKWVHEMFQSLTKEKLINMPSASDLEKVLLEIEHELFNDWGEAFETHWSTYFEQFTENWDNRPDPKFVELPFGTVPNEESGKMELLYESVQFGTEEDEPPAVQVRGRIDRIDVGERDGRAHYNVIDFKTGNVSKFNIKQLLSGKKLQLAIYTLAVKRLGLIGENAIPFDLGYWLLNESGFMRGITTHPKRLPTILGEMIINRLENILDELIPKLAFNIRDGQFPIYNEDIQCGQHCEYKTICRVGQIRSLPESRQKRITIGIDDPEQRESDS